MLAEPCADRGGERIRGRVGQSRAAEVYLYKIMYWLPICFFATTSATWCYPNHAKSRDEGQVEEILLKAIGT